jgi:hypothetical protein
MSSAEIQYSTPKYPRERDMRRLKVRVRKVEVYSAAKVKAARVCKYV